jgi:hypothetical protein
MYGFPEMLVCENEVPKPEFTVDQIIDKMLIMFDGKIADPTHSPIESKYQFRLAKAQLLWDETKREDQVLDV